VGQNVVQLAPHLRELEQVLGPGLVLEVAAQSSAWLPPEQSLVAIAVNDLLPWLATFWLPEIFGLWICVPARLYLVVVEEGEAQVAIEGTDLATADRLMSETMSGRGLAET
jgi:hypothetical protein